LLRMIGAACIVAMGYALGRLAVENMQLRPRHIRAVRTMLEQLRSEMDYGLTPIPELMRRIAGQQPDPVATFARAVLTHLRSGEPARQAWQAALTDVYPLTALTQGDLEALTVLGRTLGTSHVEDQVRHIELAVSRLEHNLQEAVAQREENAKLYTYLGVIASLALVIVLA